MTAPSITLTSRQFAALVKPVIPLAANDEMLPLLNAVHITTRGRYVLAEATDRFRAGIQRVGLDVIPDAKFEALVPLTSLKRILAMWRPSRTSDPDLRFTVTPQGLKVVQAGGFDFIDASITLPLETGNFPNLAALVTKEWADDAPVAMVNPTFLADFRHAVTDGSPIAIRVGEVGGPIRVTVGEDFVGVLMRMRSGEGNAHDHLAEWVAFLTDKPAKKKASAA